MTAPAKGVIGKTVNVNMTVNNGGTAAAGACTVQLRLSKDKVISADDAVLGQKTLAGVAAGASLPVTAAVTIPRTTVAGTWYILALADAAQQVVELDEANNAGASSTIQIARK